MNTPHQIHAIQHGSALLFMLALLMLIATLVTSSSFNTFKLAREQTNTNVLAQARNALIAYAVADITRPGELPCPDVNDDGKLTMNVDYVGSNCISPIGRLPWKTLGLTELRDGSGEHLWYVVAKSFWANGSGALNSDAQGNFNISGMVTASNVVAIVFASGAPLLGQSRSPNRSAACATQGGGNVAENLCAANYLESLNAAQNLPASQNINFTAAISDANFNDQLVWISAENIFPAIEKRVAHEVKNALLNFAASNGGAYPYPANLNNCTFNSANPSNSICNSDASQCRGWLPLATPGYNNWALPAWIANNGWYRTMPYAVDFAAVSNGNTLFSSCSTPLTLAGNLTRGLFFTSGTPLRNYNQMRPSTSLMNYLEDAENLNFDNVYALPSATANDTLYSLP